MIIRNLKSVLRNVRKNGIYSIINIAGLTIGLACFILIYLFVQYEKSYDTFHSGYGNLYRVVQQVPGSEDLGTDMYCSIPGPLAPLVKETFPEVMNATRVFKRQRLVHYEQVSAIEDRVLYVDPDFLNMFSFRLLSGDAGEALNVPNSIILTERSAKKYFGKEDPVGKTILIDENQKYLVTGVIADAPDNSHIKFDFLSTISTSIAYDSPSYNWGSSTYQTYIRLKNGQSPEEFDKKLNKLCDEQRENVKKVRFWIQPVADIHLNGSFNKELEINGDKSQVYTFYITGIVILLMACFNYVNLTSAHLSGRMKVVGIKRISGAKGYELFFQIIGESALYVLASAIIALLLVRICLPSLNMFLQKDIPFSLLFDVNVLSGWLLFVLGLCILSGIIPAILMIQGRSPAIS